MDEETAGLIELLRTTRRGSMRLSLVRSLADRHDPDVAAALLDVVEQSSDVRIVPVVTAALEGLSRFGPGIAPLLLSILENPSDPRRAFMPLLLAANLGTGAVQYLIGALADQDLEVRINAATQLGQLADRSAFEPIRALLEDAAQPAALRGVAAAALGALRDPRALPLLAALSATNDPDLLAGAIDGLADLRDPAGIPYLEAILERPGLDGRIERAVRLGLLAMERYRER